MAALTTPARKHADADASTNTNANTNTNTNANTNAPERSTSSDSSTRLDSKTQTASDSRLHTSSTSRLQDYEKLSVIGSGAAAVVYLVRHRESRELFALKVQQISVSVELSADDRDESSSSSSSSRRQTRRAFKELEVLRALEHPFVTRLHDSFEDGATLCLVLELCEGGTVADVQAFCGGRLREHEAAFYAAELVLALEYVHTMGVVHRDVKPQNVLVGRDGHVRLADFGVAQRGDHMRDVEHAEYAASDASGSCGAHDSQQQQYAQQHSQRQHQRQNQNQNQNQRQNQKQSQRQSSSHCVIGADNRVRLRSHSFVGTAEYMAPEMILQTPQSTDVDWWALGCVLYELVFGVAPFRPPVTTDSTRSLHDAAAAQFRATLACRVTFPATAPDVSDACKDLLTRLLARDPSVRLGHCGGAAEVKQHRFFAGVQWALLKHATPPVVLTAPPSASLSPLPVSSSVSSPVPSPVSSPVVSLAQQPSSLSCGAGSSQCTARVDLQQSGGDRHDRGDDVSTVKRLYNQHHQQQEQEQQQEQWRSSADATAESLRAAASVSSPEDTCDEELDQMILESPSPLPAKALHRGTSSATTCACERATAIVAECYDPRERKYERSDGFVDLRTQRTNSFVDAVLRHRRSFASRLVPAASVSAVGAPARSTKSSSAREQRASHDAAITGSSSSSNNNSNTARVVAVAPEAPVAEPSAWRVFSARAAAAFRS